MPEKDIVIVRLGVLSILKLYLAIMYSNMLSQLKRKTVARIQSVELLMMYYHKAMSLSICDIALKQNTNL